MDKILHLSRFSHCLEKDGVFAYFHSMRMRPVFLDHYQASLVEQLRTNPDVNTITVEEDKKTDFHNALEALKKDKILVKNKDFDNKIISRFRDAVPSPYIQIAYFVLTENCNFNCSYCFVKRDEKTNSNTSKNMSIDTAEKGLYFFFRANKKRS